MKLFKGFYEHKSGDELELLEDSDPVAIFEDINYYTFINRVTGNPVTVGYHTLVDEDDGGGGDGSGSNYSVPYSDSTGSGYTGTDTTAGHAKLKKKKKFRRGESELIKGSKKNDK